jgi:hypothetical protein
MGDVSPRARYLFIREDPIMNPKRLRSLGFFCSGVVLLLVAAWRPTYGQNPLQIQNVQVLNTNANHICQHVFDLTTQTYVLAWQSAPLEGYHSVRIGDIDNDGAKEIVASVLWQNRTETIKVGKKTTTQTWGSYRIEVFENGAAFDGGPSWSYDIPGEVLNSLPNDSYIADVDNDSLPGYPDNELVLIRSTELDLFHFPGQQTEPSKEHLFTYPAFLFSLEVGDADNDGFNELVVVPGNSSSLRIWKHLPDHLWEQKTADPVPSSLWEPGATYAGVTYLKVRDADNLAGREIIATGNNQRLMVWKYDGGGYRLISWSDPLPPGTMAYGIDSGNLDGDNLNEVVISLWGGKKYPARLAVLSYEGDKWITKNAYNSYYADQRDLRLGDLDGDLRPEVALNNGGDPAGLKVLRFVGASLGSGTFEEVYTAPGYGYTKVEIR